MPKNKVVTRSQAGGKRSSQPVSKNAGKTATAARKTQTSGSPVVSIARSGPEPVQNQGATVDPLATGPAARVAIMTDSAVTLEASACFTDDTFAAKESKVIVISHTIPKATIVQTGGTLVYDPRGEQYSFHSDKYKFTNLSNETIRLSACTPLTELGYSTNVTSRMWGFYEKNGKSWMQVQTVELKAGQQKVYTIKWHRMPSTLGRHVSEIPAAATEESKTGLEYVGICLAVVMPNIDSEANSAINANASVVKIEHSARVALLNHIIWDEAAVKRTAHDTRLNHKANFEWFNSIAIPNAGVTDAGSYDKKGMRSDIEGAYHEGNISVFARPSKAVLQRANPVLPVNIAWYAPRTEGCLTYGVAPWKGPNGWHIRLEGRKNDALKEPLLITPHTLEECYVYPPFAITGDSTSAERYARHVFKFDDFDGLWKLWDDDNKVYYQFAAAPTSWEVPATTPVTIYYKSVAALARQERFERGMERAMVGLTRKLTRDERAALRAKYSVHFSFGDLLAGINQVVQVLPTVINVVEAILVA